MTCGHGGSTERSLWIHDTVACGRLAIFSTRNFRRRCLLLCTSYLWQPPVITGCYFSRLNSLQYWNLLVTGRPLARHGPFFSRLRSKSYVLWLYSDDAFMHFVLLYEEQVCFQSIWTSQNCLYKSATWLRRVVSKTTHLLHHITPHETMLHRIAFNYCRCGSIAARTVLCHIVGQCIVRRQMMLSCRIHPCWILACTSILRRAGLAMRHKTS